MIALANACYILGVVGVFVGSCVPAERPELAFFGGIAVFGLGIALEMVAPRQKVR